MRSIKRAWTGLKALALVFTALILMAAFTPIANMLAGPLVVKERIARAGAIVVLGGGAYANGVLGSASNERLIRGMLLFKAGYAPRIFFTGGSFKKTSSKVMRTVLNTRTGGPPDVSEAGLMSEVALKMGLPAGAVLADPFSANTHENISNAKLLMDGFGAKDCLLVTSPTHMRRAMAVAEKLGLKCLPAPAADYTNERTGAIDRLSLLREVLWEYAALVLYWVYGYI